MDVPVHVTHVDESENSVVVEGGTNWLIQQSRKASDVKLLAEPSPVVPDFSKIKPVLSDKKVRYTAFTQDYSTYLKDTVAFTKDCYKLSKAQLKALKAYPKSATGYTIVGYATAEEKAPQDISEKRAYEIAKALVSFGKGKVTVLEPGYGAEVQDLIKGNPRRVEIYELPQK